MSKDEWNFTPLTGRISGRDLRAFRRRVEPDRSLRLWPKVLSLLGTVGLVIFLSIYVTDAEWALVPWFALGIALLFLVAWILVLRAASHRWRLRYRLDGFARANAMTIENDVTDPGGPWEAYGGGEQPKLVVRLAGRDRLGAFEVGIRSHGEPTPAGNTRTVEDVYLLMPPSESAIHFDETLDLAQPSTWRKIAAAREAAAIR